MANGIHQAEVTKLAPTYERANRSFYITSVEKSHDPCEVFFT